MDWKTKPALTRAVWLNALGLRLVWYFSAPQVTDILSDYQEQFDMGHDHCKTEAEIIQALGTPAEAAAILLEEDPSAKNDCLRNSVLWGAVLAVCCCFSWVCMSSLSFALYWIGSVLFIPLAASSLFMLIRGPIRMAKEKLVPTQKPPSVALVYYVPAVILAVCFIENLAVRLGGRYLVQRQAGQADTMEWSFRVLRYGNVLFLLGSGFLLALVAVWGLVSCVRSSIRYFPGFVHAFGAVSSVYFMLTYFTSIYIADYSGSLELDLPLRLVPYGIGLAVALSFQQWIDGRKPLPGIFQGDAAVWEDWRHQLGVRLLGWFSVEQTVEILEDYQEQYELGREQNTSEERLLSQMGRPEAVVRDLLAEDRKARLRQRKLWPWVAMAAVSAWLLLGYASVFGFGIIGLNPLYYGPNSYRPGLIALPLGTVSLSVLLHVRERAAVEQRFPAPQKPTLWIYLPPLVCSTLVEGLALGCIYRASDPWEPVFLGQPLTWYIIISLELSLLLLTVLLIWTLVRCVSGSIRYFPAVPFLAGSFAQIGSAGLYLSCMDLEYVWTDLEAFVHAFLFNIWPWGVGLLLAVISRLILYAAGKKGA